MSCRGHAVIALSASWCDSVTGMHDEGVAEGGRNVVDGDKANMCVDGRKRVTVVYSMRLKCMNDMELKKLSLNKTPM